MPSSSVGFSFGFICGQLGGALYLSFHHIKIQNASGRGLILTTEFSIPTLVAVILSILAVDGLVLIFYRYLCTSAKHQPNGALKFKAATSSARHFRLLATVFSVPSSFSRWRVVHRPTLAPATVLPLVENPTSLTPATETVSPPLQPVSLAAGHSGVQDSSNEDANICRHDIKQEAEQKIDTDTEDNLARSSRKHERIEASPAKAVPVVRHSHALLLLHVAAAAQMRRKLQAKVVVEPCHTKIVEDAEEVEKIGEKIGEIVKDVEDLAKEVVADSMKTLVVETLSSASSPEEKNFEDTSGDHAFGIPLIEELDGVPTYEEFAQDAPLEPLFEQSAFTPLHVVHRPPPLSILAARTSTSVKPRGAGVSRLPLLARLFSRVADPISA